MSRLPTVDLVACAFLASIAYGACGYEVTAPPPPWPEAHYEPRSLDFGNVWVGTERTLIVSLRSIGDSVYRIESFTLEGESEGLRVDVDSRLVNGLPIGRASTISVTFRPCPAAWKDGRPNPIFDLQRCPFGARSGSVVISDGSEEGEVRIPWTASAALPAHCEIACPSGLACAPVGSAPTTCTGIELGEVTFVGQLCRAFLEIRNVAVDERPVAPIAVERIEVLVEKVGTPEVLDGEEVGFQVFDAGGVRLAPTRDAPLLVPIEPGAREGIVRFELRYDGSAPGTWRGDPARMTGLRLHTSNPAQPICDVAITASSI